MFFSLDSPCFFQENLKIPHVSSLDFLETGYIFMAIFFVA